jgi:hypothetical protein
MLGLCRLVGILGTDYMECKSILNSLVLQCGNTKSIHGGPPEKPDDNGNGEAGEATRPRKLFQWNSPIQQVLVLVVLRHVQSRSR